MILQILGRVFAKFRRPLPEWEQEVVDAIRAGEAELINDCSYKQEWKCEKIRLVKHNTLPTEWIIAHPTHRFLTRRGKLAIIKELRKQGLIDFQLFTVRNFAIFTILLYLFLKFGMAYLWSILP